MLRCLMAIVVLWFFMACGGEEEPAPPGPSSGECFDFWNTCSGSCSEERQERYDATLGACLGLCDAWLDGCKARCEQEGRMFCDTHCRADPAYRACYTPCYDLSIGDDTEYPPCIDSCQAEYAQMGCGY